MKIRLKEPLTALNLLKPFQARGANPNLLYPVRFDLDSMKIGLETPLTLPL